MIKHRTNLKDIAREAGVSVVAVSSALSGKGRISLELAHKIRQIAQEKGYVRNTLASSMATGKSNTIAFVINHEDINAGHISLLLGGILNVLEKYNYSLKIYDAESLSRETIIRRLQEQQINGVLLHHYSLDFLIPWLKDLHQIDIPCCILNMNNTSGMGGCVISDEAKGTEEAVDYLASLGHTRIMHLTVDQEFGYVKERRAGYLAGMSKISGAIPQIETITIKNLEPNQIKLRTLLNQPASQRPTAIVCSSDHHALELFRAAYTLGLSLPRDLSIIGFGNLDLSVYSPVPLTTVAQPFNAIGAAATELIMDAIEHNQSIDQRKVLLPSQLIFRDSATRPASIPN